LEAEGVCGSFACVVFRAFRVFSLLNSPNGWHGINFDHAHVA